MGAFSAGCHDHNDPIKCDKRLGGVPASTADADNSDMAQPPNSRPTVPRTEATGKASDLAEVDAEVGTSAAHRRSGDAGPSPRYFHGQPELPRPTGEVYQWVMAERATPPRSPSRYAAVAALFAALEKLINDYRSLPDSEHVRRWSEDADHITGEVARDLAIARTHISAAPPHDAR